FQLKFRCDIGLNREIAGRGVERELLVAAVKIHHDTEEVLAVIELVGVLTGKRKLRDRDCSGRVEIERECVGDEVREVYIELKRARPATGYGDREWRARERDVSCGRGLDAADGIVCATADGRAGLIHDSRFGICKIDGDALIRAGRNSRS